MRVVILRTVDPDFADVFKSEQIVSQSRDVGTSHLMKTADSFAFNELTVCDHVVNSKANFSCLGMSFISEIARQVNHLQYIFKRSIRIFAFGFERSLVESTRVEDVSSDIVLM